MGCRMRLGLPGRSSVRVGERGAREAVWEEISSEEALSRRDEQRHFLKVR